MAVGNVVKAVIVGHFAGLLAILSKMANWPSWNIQSLGGAVGKLIAGPTWRGQCLAITSRTRSILITFSIFYLYEQKESKPTQ